MATKKDVVRYIAVATSPHGNDSYVSDGQHFQLVAAEEALDLYVDATGYEKEDADLVIYHVIAHSTYDVERPVEAKLTLRKTITY